MILQEKENQEISQPETPKKVLPFAPGTERVEPSIFKIILMTLGVMAAMLLIGWIRSKIGM